MNRSPQRLTCLAATLALGMLLPTGSWAGDKGDHDLARTAVESGEVLPLKTVLAHLERQRPGNVLEVELERKGSGWVYEIKQLEAGGQLARIKLDAKTAQILSIKGAKGAPADDEHTRPPR